MQIKQNTILPPATIGIIGGGQLGRMFSLCAKQMGYTVALLEPSSSCPAKNFVDFHIQKNYDDIDGLLQLAQIAKVITTEFENVPSQALQQIAEKINVFPNHKQLAVAQNRRLEKSFFNKIGIPTTKYIIIEVDESSFEIKPSTLQQIKKQQNDIFPAILKTTTLGYDGKGQVKVESLVELEAKIHELCNTSLNSNYSDSTQKTSDHTIKQLNKCEFILEKQVSLFKEASVIVAANNTGIELSPIIENHHHNGILDISIAPAKLELQLKQQIKDYATLIVKSLDYIGVITIEFFITTEKEVLANEMAPRPHNSGHLTLDACQTSQFEQQVRAVCGLKLGKFTLHSEAVMLNILGGMYTDNTLNNLNKLLTDYPNLKLYLYEKNEAKLGRKMGHLTLLGSNISNQDNLQSMAKVDNMNNQINDKISVAYLLNQAKHIRQLMQSRPNS